MKAALALIFFACVAGSMASDAHNNFLSQLAQQGQAVAQTVFNQLQQQILALAQQAIGQISTLVGSFGRFDLNISTILDQLKALLATHANQALVQVLGSLQGLMGGRAGIDLAAIFSAFLAEITPAVTGLGQHFLNQGLASVLGGLGGSRAIGDIFAALSQQVGAAVTAAQGALTGALGGLQNLGSTLLDASKPHWTNLQEQLVGHGLNVLGSISETVNNLHGSITGGR